MKEKTAVEALADLVMEKRNKETKKDIAKKERELKAKRFIFVDKKDYHEYRKVRELREETRPFLLSKNL